MTLDSSPYLEALPEDSLPDNSMEIVELQGKRIVVVKYQGKTFAIDNTCPHLGGSLGRGSLRNYSVICPLHHWTFDLATGKCLDGLPDEPISTYETKVENGKILVKIA